MKTLLHALKYSGVVAMLFAASCGVGAAPTLGTADSATNAVPVPNTAERQANTTRNPSSRMNRAPADMGSGANSRSSPSMDTDTLQQQRQQGGEQMIQERKGRAADSN